MLGSAQLAQDWEYRLVQRENIRRRMAEGCELRLRSRARAELLVKLFGGQVPALISRFQVGVENQLSYYVGSKSHELRYIAAGNLVTEVQEHIAQVEIDESNRTATSHF